MGHAVSKTAEENEIFEQPDEASAKEFSSNETVNTFADSTLFDDAAKSKISNSQPPLAQAESLEEEALQPKVVPSTKSCSEAPNGNKQHFRFSNFSRNGETKTVQNFVGKIKNKFLRIDNVLHSKAEASDDVKATDASEEIIPVKVPKKSKRKKLQPVSDPGLEELNEAKIVKQNSFEVKEDMQNPPMQQLEIFVDAKGGLKVDLTDGKKTDKLRHRGKKIVLENTEIQLNSNHLGNLAKIEKVEKIQLAKNKRKLFCKNIENLGIKKEHEVMLLQNQKSKENQDKLASNGFRKQFFGNKYDEDIISLENLMLMPKGNGFGKKCKSSKIIKIDGLQIATPKVTVAESEIKPSLEVINMKPISEALIENKPIEDEFPIHKVLIRACSKGNHVKFDNPFSMFDMIIPEQLKTSSNNYKNSSVSLSSYTSQATENDVSDIDEILSSFVTTSSIPKTRNLDNEVDTDFCSSSEMSDESNFTKMSLQRMQGLTSFSVNGPNELECFYALQKISNPSAKFTFLMELKHKRKFKTLEELYQKPIQMINFLYRGELFEPHELEPVESFISYEEILNSIVSGI